MLKCTVKVNLVGSTTLFWHTRCSPNEAELFNDAGSRVCLSIFQIDAGKRFLRSVWTHLYNTKLETWTMANTSHYIFSLSVAITRILKIALLSLGYCVGQGSKSEFMYSWLELQKTCLKHTVRSHAKACNTSDFFVWNSLKSAQGWVIQLTSLV